MPVPVSDVDESLLSEGITEGNTWFHISMFK